MKNDVDLIWEAYLYKIHSSENLEEGRFTNLAAGLGLGAAALFGGMGKAKGAEPSPQDFAKSGPQILDFKLKQVGVEVVPLVVS